MKAFLTVLIVFFCSLLGFSQESQNDEIAKLSSGSFPVYKVIEKSRNNFKFEKASKPWPVEFKMNGTNCKEVLIKRAGIIDELYKADLEKFPAYYDNSASEIVVSVVNKKIYYYKWSIKSGAEIVYILTDRGVSSYETEKNTIDEYRRNILPLQENARQERQDAKDELAAIEYEKNTLEGKDIQSINVKFVDEPGDIGLLTIVRIGVEVKLGDGTVLKTKNLGGATPYSDFEFEFSGGNYAGGDFKVASDSREIPGDRIIVKARSKFANNSVTGELNHPINYKSNIFYQYQGKSGGIGRANVVGYSKHGGNGASGRVVNVYADQQTINGETVNVITITDANSGELLAESKLHISSQITINVNGGHGGNGADGAYSSDGDGGDGGDGGDAGSVFLSGSGAYSIDITVLSSGGSGGNGGNGKASYNSNGSKGSRGSDGALVR